MCDKTRVEYAGTALLLGGTFTSIFSSTVLFGPKAAPHYRCFWFDVAVTVDVAGSVQLQRSSDGGVTWAAAGTAQTAAVGHSLHSFFVSPYQDWRVIYTNGASPQGVFNLDMVIDHTSRDNPP